MNTYTCYYEDCQKTYNSKYNLIRHINSFHLDNKSYVCSFCSKGFYNKLCLDEHISGRGCESFPAPKWGLGLISDLTAITDISQLKIQTTHKLHLPVLPLIETERQIPLYLAKLPLLSIVFSQGRAK